MAWELFKRRIKYAAMGAVLLAAVTAIPLKIYQNCEHDSKFKNDKRIILAQLECKNIFDNQNKIRNAMLFAENVLNMRNPAQADVREALDSLDTIRHFFLAKELSFEVIDYAVRMKVIDKIDMESIKNLKEYYFDTHDRVESLLKDPTKY